MSFPALEPIATIRLNPVWMKETRSANSPGVDQVTDGREDVVSVSVSGSTWPLINRLSLSPVSPACQVSVAQTRPAAKERDSRLAHELAAFKHRRDVYFRVLRSPSLTGLVQVSSCRSELAEVFKLTWTRPVGHGDLTLDSLDEEEPARNGKAAVFCSGALKLCETLAGATATCTRVFSSQSRHVLLTHLRPYLQCFCSSFS